MNSSIEVPIPPTTLPLLHDAMCTIVCTILEIIGPPKKIEITYDEVKGLGKFVEIEIEIDCSKTYILVSLLDIHYI